jgi:DNA-binding beta-propeller fold protein YncE
MVRFNDAARWRVATAFVLWLLAGGAMAAEPRMQVDPSWPRPLPHDWSLGEISGAAVDAADNVWIIQRPDTLAPNEIAAPPVVEFDPAGNVVRAWGGPGAGYNWPQHEHGIYVDAHGFVWLAGNGAEDGQVLKFTSDGKFVLQIGRPGHGSASNDVTRLSRPAGIAVDPAANEVYVADGYGNRRVIVFDAGSGAYKRHWGAYGGRPADTAARYDPKAPPSRQFGRPVHCIKLARDGLVYVCDRQNDRVQVFHTDGSFVTEWRIAPQTVGLGSVWDLAFWPDSGQTLLFAADGTNNQVRILRRSDGAVLGSFGRPGRQPGQFDWVHTMAIDSHGDVFTTEVHSVRRVQRFAPTSPP